MANSRIWMPLYVGDYLKDTSRLTVAEHGAYLLLIFEYWQSGSLPDDDETLARILRLDIREWKRLRPAVSSFFQPGWKHNRIERELAKSQAISEKRRSAARAMHKAQNVVAFDGARR